MYHDEKEQHMSFEQQMIQTHRAPLPLDAAALAECISACFACAQACTACADACLAEPDLRSLIRCIRLNLDCANLCDATGHVLSRQTAFEPAMARAALAACAEACRVCGDECSQHAQHGMEHCNYCAEACRRCGAACNRLLGMLAA